MKDKESWEQTRMMGYITAQVNSTKPMKPEDLMSFPWEKGVEVHHDTKEDIENMMVEMERYKKKLNRK